MLVRTKSSSTNELGSSPNTCYIYADNDRLDYGRSRPNILIAVSILAFAIGFGWMGVYTPDKWQAATGLYIVGRMYARAEPQGSILTRLK